jgi:dolichol-phosphate mannosyltransferase
MRVVRFVLPAYNEAASISDLLDRIREVAEGAALAYHVLVVDDGSADDTGDIARAKAAEMPVEVVRNEPNGGLGFTIRRGLRLASEAAGDDDVLVTLDADLTQDPAYVPSMLAALDDRCADVVIASRYRRGSGVEGLSAFRRLLSYGASGAVALLRPVRGVRDYSCGFRVYRAHVIRWGFETYGDDFVSENGFACMVEIAERLRGHAMFAEVPFVLRYDAKRKRSEIRILPTMGAYMRVLHRVRADMKRLGL